MITLPPDDETLSEKSGSVLSYAASPEASLRPPLAFEEPLISFEDSGVHPPPVSLEHSGWEFNFGDVVDAGRDAILTIREKIVRHPGIKRTCLQLGLSPEVIEFMETPLAISLLCAIAYSTISMVVISFSLSMSLFPAIAYQIIRHTTVWTWRVFCSFFTSLILFLMVGSTLVGLKYATRLWSSPSLPELQRIATEIRNRDWASIIASAWAAIVIEGNRLVQLIQTIREKRRQRRMERRKRMKSFLKNSLKFVWMVIVATWRVSAWVLRQGIEIGTSVRGVGQAGPHRVD